MFYFSFDRLIFIIRSACILILKYSPYFSAAFILECVTGSGFAQFISLDSGGVSAGAERGGKQPDRKIIKVRFLSLLIYCIDIHFILKLYIYCLISVACIWILSKDLRFKSL